MYFSLLKRSFGIEMCNALQIIMCTTILYYFTALLLYLDYLNNTVLFRCGKRNFLTVLCSVF